MAAHSKLLLFLRATFTRTYPPPPSPLCPLLLSLILCLVVLSPHFLAHPSSLKALEVLLQKFELVTIVSRTGRAARKDRAHACMCAYIRTGKHCWSFMFARRGEGGGRERKEEGGHKSKQAERVLGREGRRL